MSVTEDSFGPCWCNHDATTGGHWHHSINKPTRLDDGGNVPQQHVQVNLTVTDQAVHVRTLERRNQKLQERLNRISNAMVGNQRIWQLDRFAMECEVEADLLEKEIADDLAMSGTKDDGKMMSSDDRFTAYVRIEQARSDALFIRRLEWDLGELHVAVRGDTNRRGGRYDQAEWKGQRP